MGSVFFHSLINNYKKILSILIILDNERIYRNLPNTNKPLINILNEKTFFYFLIKKLKTKRYGDISKYND
jgi:hypothetical protein